MDTGKVEKILFISFCALIIPPILYICRSADNNTFTSWVWVFSGAGILRLFFILIPGLFCAYAISRVRASGAYSYALLIALSLVAIIPAWRGPEAVIDAARYFLQAKSLKEYGVQYFLSEWGNEIHAWTDMPLVPFIYGLVFKWLGEARVYIQALNTVFFALTVVLTFLIGKKLWDEEVGMDAGLLLMGIPYLLTQVPLMLVDVATMFFMVMSVYFFLLALERKGFIPVFVSAVAISMAMFSKYSTWLMLLVIPAIAVVRIGKDPKRVIGRTLAVLLVTCILSGVVVYLHFDLFRDQIMTLRTYQWSGLSRWQEGYLSTFLFQTHPGVTGLALFGIFRAVRKRDSRFIIAGFFALFVVLLQVKRIRYILPLFPLFALMAAYGLNMIIDKGVKRFISLSILASSLVIVHSAYLPFLNKTGMANLRHAGEYLDTLKCDSVEVYALPQKTSSGSTFTAIPILDYHTSKNIFSIQEWPRRPEGAAGRSSMRFTWEIKKPAMYSQPQKEKPCAVAVISSDTTGPLPGGSAGGELKIFDLTAEQFKYQTVVIIIEKSDRVQSPTCLIKNLFESESLHHEGIYSK